MDLIAKAVTLKSIRLHDSEAGELLFSAKHAVLYEFNGNSWVKSNTEGCLAVYLKKNNQAAPATLIILNRLQPDNFVLSLAEVGEVELEGELLMFKAGSEVMGIWLFDAEERQLLHSLIISQKQQRSAPALKSISLTELLSSNTSNNNNNVSLEESVKRKFKGHSFGNLKDFATAVAQYIVSDPSTVSVLFEELRK